MTSVWLVGVGVHEQPLAAELTAAGQSVTGLTVEEALAPDRTPPDVALISPGAQPAAVLARRLSLHAPATSWVFLLDAPPSAAQVLATLENGAADVAVAPLAPGGATALVARALREARARARLGYLERREAQGAHLEDVVASSPKMKELLEKVTRIARRSAMGPALSILLTGETGSGKGLLARMLHFGGRRRDGPFVEINCAALPATLVEAELFGFERGAFTDARAAKAGLFEAADGGTLFLDEISYLPPEGQAKLLTALDTRRVRRLGGAAERTVDVQVVAASSHDLDARVASGLFKPELLHRLTALWFQLPPLRERGEDAVLLAERFLARLCHSYRLPGKQLSEGARAAIRAHAWPGNVRELYHAMERAVLAEEAPTVEAADLALQRGAAPAPAVDVGAQGIRVHLPPEGVALQDVERALIERALAQEGGNVSRAAALLRITRDTLRSRMEKFGLTASRTGG